MPKNETEVAQIEVSFHPSGRMTEQARFTRAFIVGRDADCAVHIEDPSVSRRHVAIFPQDGRWWIRDLQSSNGTFVNGHPIEQPLPLTGTMTIELGFDGPRLRLIAPSTPTTTSSEDATSPKHAENTVILKHAQQKMRWMYGLVFAISCLLIASLGGVYYQYEQRQEQIKSTNQLANDFFYHMKEIELKIVELEDEINAGIAAGKQSELAESKRKLAGLLESYNKMLASYEDNVKKVRMARQRPLASEDAIILHIARVFGETEVDVPNDFLQEVKNYIQKWQASSRLERAIRRLNENNYAPTIIKALTDQGLPPQFIYLALQESNFQPKIVGPPTRYGHAKGMWQFIPATAKRYGLQPGPLVNSGAYDPQDERHQFDKASYAAARYLKDIYRTDAQASGLLVMASYNWGEGNLIKLIRQLPKNPRERNFWALLRHHKIPNETYNYVFYIFSAAVIGENPRLFGFDFDNPLVHHN